jgi:hypothetical protein
MAATAVLADHPDPNVFGDTIGEYPFRSPHAMQVAFLVMFNIFALAIVLVLLTWLLARRVGGTFGSFRPASMSIRNLVGRRIFPARSNGRGQPGRPADSLDMGNCPVSSLS